MLPCPACPPWGHPLRKLMTLRTTGALRAKFQTLLITASNGCDCATGTLGLHPALKQRAPSGDVGASMQDRHAGPGPSQSADSQPADDESERESDCNGGEHA